MKKAKKLVILATAGGLLVAAPFLALAQAPVIVNPPSTTGPITSGQGFVDLLNVVLKWVATAFWILAALFVFMAAYKYLTAGGDPEKVKSASSNLLYAVIAIAVAIMAYGLPVLVGNFLKGT